MITKIISIKNSRGIYIPKSLLNKNGLSDQVKLQAKKGELRITSMPVKNIATADTLLLSEKVLGTDWSRPEEDEAWVSL